MQSERQGIVTKVLKISAAIKGGSSSRDLFRELETSCKFS